MDVCIGVTVGDPAGIGPEVVESAFRSILFQVGVRLYGPAPIVERLACVNAKAIPIPTTSDLRGVETGRYTKASGEASIAALIKAVDDLADGTIMALVTGPICKKALDEAGFRSPGQTEFIAKRLGVERFAMMLAGPSLRVTLVTTHLALRDVPSALSVEKVVVAIELTTDFLKQYKGIERPRIAVLGLNPHASDDGKFGDEESSVIAPAIARFDKSRAVISGPLPADTTFYRAVKGEFDAVVAMYHDQGLGPLKLIHFAEAINITLGLPRLRCAPDHGPAYDLAGKMTANPSSMKTAISFALQAALNETS